MSEQKQLLIIANDLNMVNSIKPFIENEEVKVNHMTHEAVRTEFSRYDPHIVVLAQDSQEGATYHTNLVSQVREIKPNVKLMFVSETRDYDLLREVMRQNVYDYYQLPGEEGLLVKGVNVYVQQLNSSEGTLTESSNSFLRNERGKIYSFFSGKGGSGRSLLATNFAQTLKYESTADVLFIDLNLQYGGAESYLGMNNTRSVVDLAPVINELTEQHVRSIVEVEPNSELNVLLSPCDAEREELLPENFIPKLLRICRQSYDFVIIDLPSNMNVHTFSALVESDLIYYILNSDTPSIKTYKRIEKLLHQLGLQVEERTRFVMNQIGRDNELKPADVKGLLPNKLVAEVRRDFKGVQSTVNKGQSLRQSESKKKLLPVAKDIRKWVLSSIS